MKFRNITAETLVRVKYRPTWGICRVVYKTTNGSVLVEEAERQDKIIRHFTNARCLVEKGD